MNWLKKYNNNLLCPSKPCYLYRKYATSKPNSILQHLYFQSIPRIIPLSPAHVSIISLPGPFFSVTIFVYHWSIVLIGQRGKNSIDPLSRLELRILMTILMMATLLSEPSKFSFFIFIVKSSSLAARVQYSE
jgi:hypothetical protein